MDMREMEDETRGRKDASPLRITINGDYEEYYVDPSMRLVDFLRDYLGMTGTKISCEIGRCGACSVLVDEVLMNACLLNVYQVAGKSIQTIEGLKGEKALHPIQESFLKDGGFQCGYCTPGMVMAVQALLAEYPEPTEVQIREGLSGNLCRCTGYGGIIRAVKRAARELRQVKI